MRKSYSSKQIEEEKREIFNIVLQFMKISGMEPKLNNFTVDEKTFWSFIKKDFSFIKNKIMLRKYYVAIYMIKSLTDELYLTENLWFLWQDEKIIRVLFELTLGTTKVTRKVENKIEVKFDTKMTVSENAILCFKYKNDSYTVDLTQSEVVKNTTLALFKLLLKQIKMCHMEHIDEYFKEKINEIKEQYSDVLSSVDMKVIPDFDYFFNTDKKTKYFPFYVIVNEKYKIHVRDIKDNLVNNYIAENTIVFLEKENLLNKITGEKHEKEVKRL